MYNFSGIFYRIWAVFGIILLIGIILILFEKPWAPTFRLKACRFALLMVAIAICGSLFYASRVVFPNVSSYTGTYVDYHRNSRVAPPLPFTYQYEFSNEEKNTVFYLDVFSKKQIFPGDLEEGKIYTIYYDEVTKVIVKVEPFK